jgi:hypothetical protein
VPDDVDIVPLIVTDDCGELLGPRWLQLNQTAVVRRVQVHLRCPVLSQVVLFARLTTHPKVIRATEGAYGVRTEVMAHLHRHLLQSL